ncbi:hypothetical protein QZH41_016653 [Actinostola sp. cb2023]|nr:hypothetical protein QZH41_016653 [Actinostola sp. cb2023]
MIAMEEEDHNDLTSILQGIGKTGRASRKELLWEEQLKIHTTKSIKNILFFTRIIRLCLDLILQKNPHVLDSPKKVVYLPSKRTIRHYKSKIETKAWMESQILKTGVFEEARKQSSERAKIFGVVLLLDEMKIQENLEMSFSHGKHKFDRFLWIWREIHNHMSMLSGNTEPECQLAQQVLQFIFISDGRVSDFPSHTFHQLNARLVIYTSSFGRE